MKNTITTISLYFFPFLLMTGCSYSWENERIIGNGNSSTKSVTTADYDMIEVTGMMDIQLVNGKEGNIMVTADDNLHAYIIVEVKNNILYVNTKDNVNLKSEQGITITVPIEEISKMNVTGSGDIKNTEQMITEYLDLSIIGSGDINLSLNATEVDAEIVGSGDITLSGSTTELTINIQGSGDFKSFDFDAKSTNVTVTGSGNAKVMAKENLVARVNGSGDIFYKGNPTKTDFESNGSGKISAE
jgi:autotransporter translocation and assembly factor TamB